MGAYPDECLLRCRGEGYIVMASIESDNVYLQLGNCICCIRTQRCVMAGPLLTVALIDDRVLIRSRSI